MSVLPVHPVADLFPMLAEDELQELAEDIKQRGLLQPIVLDAEGRVLDGRNRLAACELAGVEARFETFAGDDPDGYAYATNVARRHLSKGQRAMLAVRARSLLSKGIDLADGAEVSASRISQARLVEEHAHALGDLVITAVMSLNEAYDEAKKRKQIAEEIASKRAGLADRPDLLELVDREKLSLDGAVSARQTDIDNAERLERERQSIAARLEKLPEDLAARVAADSLGIDEAEAVVKERAGRLIAWAEKIRGALDTLTRMAGNPVPADLADQLTAAENVALDTVLSALEEGDAR